MNREIKFRAWDIKNGTWLSSGFFTISNDMGESFPIIALNRNGKYKRIYEGDNAVLMQFTNLHDKNGKEIYEGDIVNAIFDEAVEDMPGQSTVHTVEWGIDHGYPAFDLIPVKGDDERVSDELNGFSYCIESGIDLEVIGNIYENPDLLSP